MHGIIFVVVLVASLCTSTVHANEPGFNDLQQAICDRDFVKIDDVLAKFGEKDINAKIDMSHTEYADFTSLQLAASRDDDYIVTILLEKGAAINTVVGNGNKKYKGFTALHLAVFHNLKKNVEVLLQDHHIDIEHIIANKDAVYNEKDSLYGFTALHLAAYLGNKEIVKLLLKKDAKENATVSKKNKTFPGYTAYQIAKKRGNEDLVHWLKPTVAIEVKKTEESQEKQEKREPGFNKLHQVVYEGDINKINEILEKSDKKDINAVVGSANTQMSGFTPLHIAVKKKRLDVVKMLLEKGSNINATVYNKNKRYAGMTALDLVNNKDKDLIDVLANATVANLLKDKKVNIHNPINTTNKELIGVTPLQYAARNGLIDVVEKLLKRGAHVNAVVSDKNEKYAGFAALHMAAISEKGKDVIKALVDNKANIGMVVSNNKKFNGYTALHLAIVHESFDNVEDYCGSLLESIIADKNAKIDNNSLYGFRPLHLAAYLGKVYAVKKLLKKDVDINATVHKDNTQFAGMIALDLAKKGKINDLAIIETSRKEEEEAFGKDLASAADARKGDENLASQKNYSKIIKILEKAREKKAAQGQK